MIDARETEGIDIFLADGPCMQRKLKPLPAKKELVQDKVGLSQGRACKIELPRRFRQEAKGSGKQSKPTRYVAGETHCVIQRAQDINIAVLWLRQEIVSIMLFLCLFTECCVIMGVYIIFVCAPIPCVAAVVLIDYGNYFNHSLYLFLVGCILAFTCDNLYDH